MTRRDLIAALEALDVADTAPVRYRDSFEYYGMPATVRVVRVITTPTPPSRWGHTDLHGGHGGLPYILLDTTRDDAEDEA